MRFSSAPSSVSHPPRAIRGHIAQTNRLFGRRTAISTTVFYEACCRVWLTTEKQKTAEMYWILGILDWIMYWICFMLLAGCFCFLFPFISFHLISFRLISFPFISSPISSHVPLKDQYLNVDQRQKKPAAKNR